MNTGVRTVAIYMTHALLSRAAWQGTVAAALLVGAACTMKSQDPPALTGPSEFAQSITVSATPDVLSQNGMDRSEITVTARGPDGEPLRNLSLKAEIRVGGVRTNFGSLSTGTIVTGSDGRAIVVYTAPTSPGLSVVESTIVSIVVTPVGMDFNNATARTAAIRVVPVGPVVPPDGLAPDFTFTPAAPQENQQVLFQACNNSAKPCAPANNPITSYSWDFGDGQGSSGRTATHAYGLAGSYTVTLSVADQYGRIATTAQQVTVVAGVNPTAVFVFSPATPKINQNIAFNAAASTAAAGRQIVGYTWDFGDGTGPRPGGSAINYSYGVVGTYNVTLVVTDDAGKTAAVTIAVSVVP